MKQTLIDEVHEKAEEKLKNSKKGELRSARLYTLSKAKSKKELLERKKSLDLRKKSVEKS